MEPTNQQMLELCCLAEIVAANDDATKTERRSLIRLAGEVKAAVIQRINANEQTPREGK